MILSKNTSVTNRSGKHFIRGGKVTRGVVSRCYTKSSWNGFIYYWWTWWDCCETNKSFETLTSLVHSMMPNNMLTEAGIPFGHRSGSALSRNQFAKRSLSHRKLEARNLVEGWYPLLVLRWLQSIWPIVILKARKATPTIWVSHLSCGKLKYGYRMGCVF
jgi:hypothetical protein